MLEISEGSLTVGHVGGAPIRVHWSTPIGAVAFTGFAFAPLQWAGFLFLVAAHELGHAAIVRFYGYRVTAIQVHGAGGACVWEGDPTAKESSVIAWGGIAAQAVILGVALIALVFVGWLPFLGGLLDVLITTNLAMMIINLVPIPPLDGAEAWKLFSRTKGSAGGKGPEYPWTHSAEWLQRLKVDRERKAAERRRRAGKATEKELRDLEEEDEEAPPIPDELQEELDRIVDEAGRGPPASPKKDPKK